MAAAAILSKMAAAAIFKNKKNHHISAAVLSDFDEIWHDDAVRHSQAVRPLKVSNLKIQDGGRHLEKPGNRHITAEICRLSRYVDKGLTDRDDLTAVHLNLDEPDQP